MRISDWSSDVCSSDLAMDRMYRLQRHVYDLTRKYYLLGRDDLIADLAARPGETVCEVGCGTARNLVRMARRYPEARLHGLDASDEMLKSAHAALARAGLAGQRSEERRDGKEWASQGSSRGAPAH